MTQNILKEHKELFDALENYDKTRILPSSRKRIDITLPPSIITQFKAKIGSSPLSYEIEKLIKERLRIASN